MKRELACVVVCLSAFPFTGRNLVCAATPAQAPSAKGKTYLLTCPVDEQVWKLPPKDLHWQELHRIIDERAAQLIQIVDRSEIDESLYIDTEGLRLHVASAECRKRFEQLPRESEDRITLAYFVRNLLLRRYSATGIEPDRIPVNGDAV